MYDLYICVINFDILWKQQFLVKSIALWFYWRRKKSSLYICIYNILIIYFLHCFYQYQIHLFLHQTLQAKIYKFNSPLTLILFANPLDIFSATKWLPNSIIVRSEALSKRHLLICRKPSKSGLVFHSSQEYSPNNQIMLQMLQSIVFLSLLLILQFLMELHDKKLECMISW